MNKLKHVNNYSGMIEEKKKNGKKPIVTHIDIKALIWPYISFLSCFVQWLHIHSKGIKKTQISSGVTKILFCVKCDVCVVFLFVFMLCVFLPLLIYVYENCLTKLLCSFNYLVL